MKGENQWSNICEVLKEKMFTLEFYTQQKYLSKIMVK